jgi:hypothetical protein
MDEAGGHGSVPESSIFLIVENGDGTLIENRNRSLVDDGG